jgi:DNA helicase II / ATP-dependent DNA helicase PcrA
VFIVGAHDGAIPASYANTPDEEAEEERLLHVGMTRARRELFMTWAATSARGWASRPSPYFDVLPGSRPARPARPGRLPAPAGAPARSGRTDRRDRSDGGPVALPKRGSGAECPHCTEPLKGIAARRLGVCAHCVTQAPGAVGERARALASVIDQAAAALGVPSDSLVSPTGLLRLLDQSPGTPAEVVATAGVSLPKEWARSVAEVLAIGP